MKGGTMIQFFHWYYTREGENSSSGEGSGSEGGSGSGGVRPVG
ncbi:MAG: hypothetical protein Q8943_04320 [Bacteroidota bacterium]|nr:hypothetical protein [Bacteroidota bacterium]